MLNVFLNEEYGYKHWWWHYPGTIEDLIIDWNTGHAPSLGKPFKGELTEIPVVSAPGNPFSSLMAGSSGSYVIHRPGEDPEEFQGNRMSDFFDATGQIDVDNPHLQVGEEFFPAFGMLSSEEQEVADTFQWADWTEDPQYYHHWFKEWARTYSCNQTNTALIDRFMEGMLSPQRAEEIASHINVCLSCKHYYVSTRHP